MIWNDISSLSISWTYFAQARKELIEGRLMDIRGGDVSALVRESWESHHGIMCVGVNWERQSRPHPTDPSL